MVLVSAGDFFMGCDEKGDKDCDDDEKLGRTVNLPAFSVDKTEVTVVDYRRCVEAKGCTLSTTGGSCLAVGAAVLDSGVPSSF